MDSPYKSYLAAALGYSAAVSALYLFGFWGVFGINVLEFIALSDLLKLAIYPLLVSLCFMLVGFAQGQLFAKAVPLGDGAKSTLGRLYHENESELLYIVASIVLMIPFFMEIPYKWFIVAFLLPFFSIPLNRVDFVIKWIPYPRARFYVLWFGILIAALAFARGRNDADEAKQGLTALVVDVQQSGIALTEAANRPVVYLGRLGEFFAMYETSTGHLVLLPSSKLDALHLATNVRHH